MKKLNIFFLVYCFFIFNILNSHTIFAGNINTNKNTSQEDTIQLDFNNTDIKLVIKTLSELTGNNFVIDESGGVRGAITVISPKKIAKKDAAKVIESILELNGFSLVQSGELIKVVHSRKAKERNIDTDIGKEPDKIPDEDRIITQIIPLTYANSNEIQKTILAFISKDSNITVYTPTNLLIITDIASNIHRLLKIIEYLDVQSAEIKTTIIPVQFASAKTIAGHIATVFGDPQTGKQQQQKVYRHPNIQITQTEKRIIKAIADDRTNTIILLANEDDTKLIIDFVKSLDTNIDSGRDDIHVYYLENSDAEELAKVLSNIPLVEKKSETGQPPNPHQIRTPGMGIKPNIVADKFNNALIINEPPENYATIKKIIKQLDIPRSQVLVEAAIVEMSLDKSLQMGIEWRSLNKPNEGIVTGFGATNFGLGAEGLSGSLGGLNVGLMKGTIDGKSGSTPNVGALLNMFKADSDFNILSTPQIVTLDNQEAEIVVSDVVPFVTNSRITDQNNVIKTYDYKDVGISLKITPHINKNTRMVRMEILQEISKVVDASVTDAVRTSKRKAKTAVIVEDGKNIVIGGLIRNDKTLAESKIPLLGDIPFLGILFKRKKEVNTKTNLMIFITPHIIYNSTDFDRVTKDKQDQLNKFMEDNKGGIKTLSSNTNTQKKESVTIDSTSIQHYDSLIIDTTAIHYDSVIVE
ncbi:MAG: type II secretion system secretin GspD [Candidatus Firestonebacteria bacterium]|nr:type II secretion system secretin GspD [Candidatus Firestonebacteria bacterium]